jgi:two-component system phosphate regulon response regulator PhoB
MTGARRAPRLRHPLPLIGETAQARAKAVLGMAWLIGLLNLTDAKAPDCMARILIADDDELIAELASEVLIDAGHACGWVTSAEEAWACVQRKRPDVLLLDHTMPGESGLTLLRGLRQSAQFYDLPVIMFTAMNGAEDEAQAIYAGAQDFIRKPFDPAVLAQRIGWIIRLRGDRPRHVDLRTALAIDDACPAPPVAMARRMI